LSSRLDEILKPGPKEIVEDLETVVIREATALRKNDRVTQLNEYYSNVSSLLPSFQTKIAQISNKFHQYGRLFHIMPKNNYFQRMSRNDQGRDSFANTEIDVLALQQQQHFMRIQYIFSSQGTECEIHRSIFSGNQGAQLIDKPEAKPVLVLRYQGNSLPDFNALASDLDKAVAKAVTLISHRIQAGK